MTFSMATLHQNAGIMISKMAISKSYYHIRLGSKNKYVSECQASQFIGVDYGIEQDLSEQLPDTWQEFNKAFIPIYLSTHPDKSKIAAGLACGAIHTLAKGIQSGDIVLSPIGNGNYLVGEVVGGYSHHPNEVLPHRRQVKWYPEQIERIEMGQALRNSTGSLGTLSNITKYSAELDALISPSSSGVISTLDPTIEDPTVFALEKHLEDFLVHNWAQTSLGERYEIYQEDGEIVGQQYPSDTGPIDILAISKDQTELLVVELKRGRASDAVVGQIQRYMGYVLEELSEPNQTVRGIIIALEDDLRIRRALKVAQNIEFYRYQLSFKLVKD
jgi:restriction system protein